MVKETLKYQGNLPWLLPRTILVTRAGSHAYGTNTPTSDEDYRGIAVPPPEYRDGFVHRFEQAQWADPDVVVYELRKFFNLAADCNPNILEVLFVENDDVLHSTPAGELLRENRQLFLSQKALHTYRGYAISQLKRIRTHRKWLLSPPTKKPTRADFNLPEHSTLPKEQLGEVNAAIQKQLDSWEPDISLIEDASLRLAIMARFEAALTEIMAGGVDDRWQRAGRIIGLGDDILAVTGRERAYKTAMDEWDRYQTWVETRNQKRAELEARFGYDTKHASHLVRLLRTCGEILSEGTIRVRRPDARELLEIRAGTWSYEALEEWAEAEDARIGGMVKTCPIPRTPDRAKLDRLCMDITNMVA